MRFAPHLAAVLLAASVSIGPVSAMEPDAPDRLIGYEEAVGLSIRQTLARDKSLPEEDRAGLDAFYESRGNAPLWIAKSGFNLKAKVAIDEIRRAAQWGLEPSDFVVPKMAQASDSAADLSRDELAAAEIKLSAAVVKYSNYARGGRIADPATMLVSYLDRKPQTIEPKKVLEGIAAAEDPADFLRKENPRHAQFEKLRQKYLAMIGGAATPDEPRIPEGPKLIPGKSHPQIVTLRARLGVPAAPGDAPEFYDEGLEAAVRDFQERNGIKADGVVSASTRAALNGSEKPSPRRILANMEQWRWMPRSLGDIYAWVNIPEFTLRVVKNGKVIHTERVITGQTDKQTPVFSHAMETVVIHPNWGVPASIMVKELWPGLARGGNPIARQGLRMSQGGRVIDPMSVNWGTADIRNFDVVQPPGPSNVLGVVKFLFPNKHQTYMHDTPTKNLFNEAQRTFSHGCMRVRNPVRLAEIVLAEDKGWTPQQVADLIKNGPENNQIALDGKINVHITYFTAWVDDAGEVQYAKDVYGHEQRIALGLEGKFNQIARLPDHLAPVRYDPAVRIAVQQNQAPIGNFFQGLFGGF